MRATSYGPGAPPRGRLITIAVLGTGIAGLVAGYELEQLVWEDVLLREVRGERAKLEEPVIGLRPK